MKKIIIALALVLGVTTLYANPTDRPSNRIGLAIDGGLAHGFLGKDLNALNTYAKPYWGGFIGGELAYELEYHNFLLRLAFGTQYSLYQNTMQFQERSHGIEEYKTLTYHYRFTKFRERTTGGHLYVPIMIGAEFDCFYFLVGTKLGFVPYQTKTQAIVDTYIWGTDEDVINPMEGLYTHNMGNYSFSGTKHSIAFNDFSATASAEIGVCFNKQKPRIDENSTDEEIFNELHRKKSFSECLQYKLSLFVDYGLTDLINHKANEELYNSAYAAETTDGLLDITQTGKVTPYSILACKPYQNAVFNNLFVGLRFAVMYDIPYAAPKKGKYAHPHLITYVRDKKTGEILTSSKVAMYMTDSTNKKTESVIDTCDKERGFIERTCPAGTYRFKATCNNYIPTEIAKYEHGNRYDTLYIDMLPKLSLCTYVVDDSTSMPLSASLTMQENEGNKKLSNYSLMAGDKNCLPMDYDRTYQVCAMSDGYRDSCVNVTFEDTALTIRLKAKPKPKYVPAPVPVNRKFILRNMYFATDKTKVLPASEKALTQLYEFLKENPSVKIKIIGHTDDVASDAYNIRLSNGRANSVKNEMVSRGIDKSRIQTEGKGEREPIVPNTSDENRQLNRRVEIEVIEGEVSVEYVRGLFDLE